MKNLPWTKADAEKWIPELTREAIWPPDMSLIKAHQVDAVLADIVGAHILVVSATHNGQFNMLLNPFSAFALQQSLSRLMADAGWLDDKGDIRVPDR